MTMLLLGAVGVQASVAQVYGIASLTGLVLALAGASVWTAVVTVASGAVAVLLMRRADIRPWQELLSLFRAMLGEEGGARSAALLHPMAVTAVAAILLGAAAYGLTRVQDGVYPTAMLALVLLLADWYLAQEVQWLPLLAILFGLCALFSRGSQEERPLWRRVLPAALIVALLAQALVPPAGTVWEPLADAAQRVRTLVSDYFHFNSPRTSYSVAQDGWQQMGERLGGPAVPDKDVTLAVTTDHTVLLRGSVRGAYTGYSWADVGLNNRYVYIDPTKASLRAQVFGTTGIRRIAAAGGAFAREEITVRFLSEGSSSLFVPGILEDLDAPLDMAMYFNEMGEVFLTRDAQPGDAYSARGYSPVHGDALAAFVEEAASQQDDRYEAIRTTYTALPEGIDRRAYALAEELVSGADQPYEQAIRICDFLRSPVFAYRTDVAYPPYGTDFVSYFLLDAKEGYCTYFATAMAVLARMVGLPSRYVEGYVAVQDGSGEEIIVTGENAHAWTEIYFRGVGWIAFDPTPSSESIGNSSGEDPQEPRETQEPALPEETPGPGKTTEPTAPPEATPEPAAEPEPDAPQETEGPDAQDEPTSPPSDDDEPDPTEEPLPGEDGGPEGDRNEAQRNWTWLFWLLGLLLLAGVALLLVLRERATRPETAAARAEDANERLLIWYRALLTVLEESGLGPRSGETPMAAARRLAESDGSWQSVLYLAEVVAVCQYGGGIPNARAMSLGHEAYATALRKAGRRARLRFLIRRMLHGIGNWKQIP